LSQTAERLPPERLSPEELRFLFVAGRSSLDFVATVGERWRRSFDRLLSPKDLARWFIDAGLLSTPPRVTVKQLGEARSLREAIYRCSKAAMARTRFPLSDVRLINDWASGPLSAPRLGTSPGEQSWDLPDPVRSSLGVLARDAVDLFGGSDAWRIRTCEAPDCALIFVDNSRGGRRRWCSMSMCGNRVKCSAYRRRKAQIWRELSAHDR
jgi:predicted RNA-binding Zn ribbon-like protein